MIKFKFVNSFFLLTIAGVIHAQSLGEQKAELLQKIGAIHNLKAAELQKLKEVFAKSMPLSQGNPLITKHPVSREACQQKIGSRYEKEFGKAYTQCQAKYMVPIQGDDPKSPCIDQFEFPNIPCEYPVVWARASEAKEICEAMGKRLCDASEWEGACGGEVLPQEFYSGATPSTNKAAGAIISTLRKTHNKTRPIRWAYGTAQNHSLCATDSEKSDACNEAEVSGKNVWGSCGSNTYPSGFFPECRSGSGVFDQHGNAAEHMSLALVPGDLTREGGSGYTEMKGSWFIFRKFSAHPDDCYWRAPFWHGSKVADPKSHQHYHLGFRCCSGLSGK